MKDYRGINVILLSIADVVFWWAIRDMPLQKHNKALVTDGIYSYVRHPRYSAFVFLVYPALGLFMHSYLCLISTVGAYVIFRFAAVLEEHKLIRTFGPEYKDYMKETPGFIPKVCRDRS